MFLASSPLKYSTASYTKCSIHSTAYQPARGLQTVCRQFCRSPPPHLKKFTMKKTYPLTAEGKHPDRVLDAVKHDIRKYLKRCRAAKLPEGVDFWNFDCKVGADAASAVSVHSAEVTKPVDAVAQAGHTSVYVAIEATHGHRVYSERAAPAPLDDGAEDDAA